MESPPPGELKGLKKNYGVANYFIIENFNTKWIDIIKNIVFNIKN